MLKYTVKRLAQSLVTILLIATIVFLLMRCLPTSFIENMARQKSMQPGSKSFDDWMAQLNAMYNMDKSEIGRAHV